MVLLFESLKKTQKLIIIFPNGYARRTYKSKLVKMQEMFKHVVEFSFLLLKTGLTIHFLHIIVSQHMLANFYKSKLLLEHTSNVCFAKYNESTFSINQHWV